ncbi:MAG: hypothetical protein IKX40_04125 [Thermoguttaceae bacterium]|nr:hypothetical protein [Thermoguttaceae bacterium]
MKRTIALSLCLAFVASVVFAFPPGMPPKENPLVTKVAPDQLGGFLSWQGTVPADASSTNKVEQALAKPEIQKELSKIQASIVESFGSSNPIASKCIDLAFKNGACFLGTTKENLAGMVSLDEKGPALVEKLTAEMKKDAASGDIQVKTINIGKMSFYKVSSNAADQDFYWGALGKGRVLVMASSEAGLTKILNNARTPEPAWVADAKKEFDIPRLSTLSGFSAEFIKESMPKSDDSADDEDASMAEFQKKFLGGDYVDKVVAASGLDNVGAVHKTAVYMKDGWKNTLPGVMIDKSLTEKDLAVIPSNAVVALAGKTDLNGLFKAVSQAEGLSDEMKMQIAMGGMVVTPYLSSLGDSWAFFMTDEGDAPGGALVWSLKNSAMAKIQLNQLMEMLKKNMQRTEQMEFEDMGFNNREMRVIPTQLKLFGDDEDEDEDDNNNNLPPNARIKIQGQGQVVIPGGQLPNGAVPIQVMPGGQLPPGAAPMGGGRVQLNAGNVDPTMLMGLIPESIEKIKIGSYDFWLLKNGEDNSSNIVIGIVGKNLVFSTKSYAEKYVTFDGTKNISSNKAVAKMMSNNPSYLIYSDPKAIVGFAALAMSASSAEPNEALIKMVAESNLPIVIGVYSTDNAVRIDANSGLPLPDLFISAGYLGFSSIQSNDEN